MEATQPRKQMDGLTTFMIALGILLVVIFMAGSISSRPQAGGTAPATASTAGTPSLESVIGPNEFLRVEKQRSEVVRAKLQDYASQGIPEAGIAAMRQRCEHLKARILEVRGNVHWSETDRATVLEPLKEELIYWEAALFRLR